MATLPISCISLQNFRNPEATSNMSSPYQSSPYYAGKTPDASGTSRAGEESFSEGDDDELLIDEESLSAEGFCKDDLYTTYLKEHYLKGQHPPGEAAKNHTKQTQSDEEDEALSFATSRLSSELSAYFGEIPVVVTPEVKYWLRYFKTSGRFEFAKGLARAAVLAPQLQPLLKKEGVPVEFFYIALIESDLNTHAHSPARAAGIWQMVAGTARLHGLTINSWIDERRDPFKSTIAAAKYLRKLHRQFSDWNLAIAAYNAGPVRIEKAIARARSRDFWQLCKGKELRLETKQFVPKILAALILGVAPRQHGFNLHKKAGEHYPTQTVQIDKAVQLSQLAELLAVPLKQIKRWNPELLREHTPPAPKGKRKWAGYNLRLPAQYAERYQQIKRQLKTAAVHQPRSHKRGNARS
jgi:membrane-bound lytic murein transglycosylase D